MNCDNFKEFSDYNGPTGPYLADGKKIFPIFEADGSLTQEYEYAILLQAASFLPH